MGKNRKTLLIIGIIVIFLLIVFFTITSFLRNKPQNIPSVIFENKVFQVELAQTDQERQLGLMYRESLDKNDGMLFVFSDDGIHSFWMKNTLIPLDMIWIDTTDGENKVVDIQTAQPCTTAECKIYTPSGKADFVLEINANLAEKYGIKKGDLVKIQIK